MAQNKDYLKYIKLNSYKINMIKVILIVFFCAATIMLVLNAGEVLRFSDSASPIKNIEGSPRASDVCMRSLIPHPRNTKDPHDTIKAMKGFHVNWLEWTYGNDAKFIQKIHAMGVKFGGAFQAGSYRGKTSYTLWNIVDIKLKPIYASWMRKWENPNPWGCANNPEFRRGHVEYAMHVLKSGADFLQRDDPAQNISALRWGGCFCKYCMDGFRKYLAEKYNIQQLKKLGVKNIGTFNYRIFALAQGAPTGDAFATWNGGELKKEFEKFQHISTYKFVKWYRSQINKLAKKRITISCNNSSVRFDKPFNMFDYYIGELRDIHATPQHLCKIMQKVRLQGKTQTVSIPLKRSSIVTREWINLIRRTMALMYALGGHIEMPWDTYLPTSSGARFFGEWKDYADITGMVRASQTYLDGYSSAFVGGMGVKDKRYPDVPISTVNSSGKIFLSVRALSGKKDAPIVIHLIEYSNKPQEFKLNINPRAFYGNRPIKFTLYTPAIYNASAHAQSQKTGDYSSLVKKKLIANGKFDSINIPALNPWGILVAEP